MRHAGIRHICITGRAKEKLKTAAIPFKKAGNMVAAKKALEKAKRLEMRLQAAEKLKDGVLKLHSK
jgi:hypothetical protein